MKPRHEFSFLLHEVAHLARTMFDQRARSRGMTRAQWVILLRLERTPGLSQTDLASILEVEPITVGRLIDRLEAKSLVERRDDPKDRRTYRLHLTPKAKPILQEIGENISDLSELMASGLDKQTLDVFTEGLKKMKANLTATDSSLRKTAG